MYPPDRMDDYRRRAQQRTIADALRPPRQPWDERTPGGQTVQELMRGATPGIRPQGMPDLMARIESPMARIRSGNVPDAALQAPQAPPPQPSPRIAISSQPATGITGALNLPKPATEAQPISDVPLPSEPITAAPTSPVVGPSIRGMGQLDRNIMLREAMSSADPESRVRIAGDDIDISPPAMKGVGRRGRFSTAGEAALNALGSGDPDRPLYSLGQGLGAAVTGLVSPRAGAKINRRFDLSRLDSDIARGIQLEGAQQAVRGQKVSQGQISTRVVAEGEYPGIEAGTEIRVRIDPRTGSVTDVVGPNSRPVIADLAKRPSAGAPHYESDADGYLITVQGGRAERVTDPGGQPVKVKSKNADGEVVEVQVGGRTLRVTPGQALSYYGQVGERETKRTEEQRERQRKYDAAKAEYDQLVVDEKNAENEKNRAYEYLKGVKANASNSPRSLQDVQEAQDAAEAADTLYKSFGEKKRDAQRRMTENQYSVSAPTAAAPPPAPPGVTEASVRAEARRRKEDEDAAVQRARDFKWIP